MPTYNRHAVWDSSVPLHGVYMHIDPKAALILLLVFTNIAMFAIYEFRILPKLKNKIRQLEQERDNATRRARRKNAFGEVKNACLALEKNLDPSDDWMSVSIENNPTSTKWWYITILDTHLMGAGRILLVSLDFESAQPFFVAGERRDILPNSCKIPNSYGDGNTEVKAIISAITDYLVEYSQYRDKIYSL